MEIVQIYNGSIILIIMGPVMNKRTTLTYEQVKDLFGEDLSDIDNFSFDKFKSYYKR